MGLECRELITPELITPSSFQESKQRKRMTRETFVLFAQNTLVTCV